MVSTWDAASQPTAHPQRSPATTAGPTVLQVGGKRAHVFSTDGFFCESTAENRKKIQLKELFNDEAPY